jgi:hypothetical protein
MKHLSNLKDLFIFLALTYMPGCKTVEQNPKTKECVKTFGWTKEKCENMANQPVRMPTPVINLKRK